MLIKRTLQWIKAEAIPCARFLLANPQANISPRVIFGGDVSRARLGRGVVIAGPTVVYVSNGGGLTGSLLEVGDRTYIGEFNNIRCAGTRIVIGSDCLISQHVTMVGSNHGTAPGSLIVNQPWEGGGIEIGDDVWIGAGAVITPGSRIGGGAVVGAGAVVRGAVPPGWVVAGVPARPIRPRDPRDDTAQLREPRQSD